MKLYDVWTTKRPNATLLTYFEEPSTRTKISFEMAAHKLGMKVMSLENSSIEKGESMQDTYKVLDRLGINFFVTRTKDVLPEPEGISE